LVVLHQGLPHLAGGGAGRHRTGGETLVAGLSTQWILNDFDPAGLLSYGHSHSNGTVWM